MKNSRMHLTSLVVIAVIIAFLAGYRSALIFAEPTVFRNTQESTGDLNLQPFWEVLSILETRLVYPSDAGRVSNEEKVWGAIHGLTDAYGDPYTTFFSPEEFKIFEADVEGSFSGVGMEIGSIDNILTVIAPLKGTPADRAGIKSGDQIIAIEGEPALELSPTEAALLIRGENGTTVELTITREDVEEPFVLNVVRENILIPTFNAYERTDDIFVIELYNFSATVIDDFRKALRRFVQSNTNKLILDLRGNPGGFLDAAVDVSSYFLPTGKPIAIEDRGGGAERIYRSKGYNIVNDDIEVVILVDGGSASASEILAGALQVHDKAVLIGEQTFGKGSVQELIDITRDTALKVTVSRWLTPDRKSISDGGLTPDIEVIFTEDDSSIGTDPQLEAAIEYLNK